MAADIFNAAKIQISDVAFIPLPSGQPLNLAPLSTNKQICPMASPTMLAK